MASVSHLVWGKQRRCADLNNVTFMSHGEGSSSPAPSSLPTPASSMPTPATPAAAPDPLPAAEAEAEEVPEKRPGKATREKYKQLLTLLDTVHDPKQKMDLAEQMAAGRPYFRRILKGKLKNEARAAAADAGEEAEPGGTVWV